LVLDVLGSDPANDYAARSLLFEGCRVIGCGAGQRLLSAFPAPAPGDEKGSRSERRSEDGEADVGAKK